MSVQTLYRLYREEKLLVNRAYQRKLVWTVEEKQKLIDSILNGLPIPLILLAEKPKVYGNGVYEIIDGMQRLNAIFSFIENIYDFDGRFFDVRQLARANQANEEGIITARDSELLEPKSCANITDYQLAVTIYPSDDEDRITEVFGRINSNGKQLSPQERRQAGVTSQFSSLVRRLACEIRGDVSQEIVLLTKMPEISIFSDRNRQTYGVKAEDTVWCYQGILSTPQLRDSEDEQMLADICASILMEEPIAVSQELLDEIYLESSYLYREIEDRLTIYGVDKLFYEVTSTMSILKEVILGYSQEPNSLRNVVRGKSKSRSPIKTPFYAIFMAFFDLIVTQRKTPVEYENLINSLFGIKLTSSKHYTTTPERQKNIKTVKGLIQDFFVDKEPSAFTHGPGLSIAFKNAIQRAISESPKYEFKQGIVNLSTKRDYDNEMLYKLVQTACGIANSGAGSDGYIFLGVADKEADAKRIQQLDGVNPERIGNYYVVGIDRELLYKGIAIDDYLKKLISIFRNSELTNPLKTQLLSNIDIVTYKKLTVIRIIVPGQKQISFIGQEAYTRHGSNTIEVKGPEIAAIASQFSQRA